MKKILFLAPATNYHTKKWCNYFQKKGYEVHVISLTNCVIPNVNVHCIQSSDKSNEGDFRKIGYLLAISRINHLYKEIKPDIVSVHYATSYGLLAALSIIKKYSLSVWGTDVYAFPKKSILHKALVKYSLKKATVLLSTSQAMAQECKYLTKKEFYITPFGVDMDLFKPSKKAYEKHDSFVISNMKSLSPEYGTDVLLKAIGETLTKIPDIRLIVNIAGNGPSEHIYKSLSKKLGIDDHIKWLGLVPQNVIISNLIESDIAVIPSYRESFGVSAVEAQACGIPVVISDVEGLKEATCPGKSSIVFKAGDYRELSDIIIDLYTNPSKRIKMGEFARNYVVEKFEYEKCFKHIERILNDF